MKNSIAYICVAIFLSGCSAVFEKSIADKSIEIYVPADSFRTKSYSQQFYWEKVTGATSYRLQIVRPSFNSALIQSFILDTIMTANSITITLNPGEYEWRLRAQNGGSETVYYTRKLFIDETAFNERSIGIKTPAANSMFSYKSNISFEWYAVSGAQNYTIEIDAVTGNFTNPIATTVDYSQLVATLVLPKRGQYKWRMYADSAGIKSLYSSIRNIDFRLDTVSLSIPGKNAINVSQNPDLSWIKPVNSLSTDQYSYKLYLYDSNLIEIDNYPATSPEPMPIVITDAETIQLKGLTKGKTYYWAIIVRDQYGIESQLTAKRKFTVAS